MSNRLFYGVLFVVIVAVQLACLLSVGLESSQAAILCFMTLAAALSLSLGARAIYSGQIVHLRTQFMELSRQSAARQATLEELKEEVRERQQ